MRRRSRPQRRVADEVLVARTSDGDPVLLNPVSTLVWDALADWQDAPGLTAVLARHFPDVRDEERSLAISDVLALLANEDLLEHAEV